MFELKITGATSSELIANAAQLAQLLVGGARFATTRANENAVKAEAVAAEVERTGAVEVKPETPAEPAGIGNHARKKPGPKAKPGKADPKQVDLEEAIEAKKPAPTLPEGGDPVPDLTGKSEPEAKKYTEFDCRHALKTIFENYEKRARDAGETDEAKIMKDKVDYARPLVYGFGVSKVPDLKPAQYADFIAKAQPYIDGTAKAAA